LRSCNEKRKNDLYNQPMLSVLIPTYNYSCYKLVEELHQQCKQLDIIFEILVSEDGGHHFLESNRKINKLKYASYLEHNNNIGRARNKNLLLDQSQFNLKLMLDSDVFPKSKHFIKNYLDFSKKHQSFACFGGLAYKNKDEFRKNLRYHYGIKRESKKAAERSKEAYKLFLTSNTLLKHCGTSFEDKIMQYGFEELVFAENLKTKNIPVFHIDNNVNHENLESNQEFINKTEEGLKTLIYLEKENIVEKAKTKISKLYHASVKLYMNNVLNWLYNLSQKQIINQLNNKGKPIWLFDLYRLLYFSKHY